MKWYGLTGGIATGKSTVSKMLAQEGVQIIDADLIAREVVEPGQPALLGLIEAFGPDIVDSSGHLDREKLGAIVFADPEARKLLEDLTHPQIGARTAALIQHARDEGLPFIIYDAALIVEKKLYPAMDGVIVVSLPFEVQLDRLMARDGLDERQARGRLDAQLPLAEKVAVADWVIDNRGTLEDTRNQVMTLLEQLRIRSAE